MASGRLEQEMITNLLIDRTDMKDFMVRCEPLLLVSEKRSYDKNIIAELSTANNYYDMY